MLKNFIKWFLIFGASFLFQILFGIEQGKAFFRIDMILYAFIFIIVILFVIINGNNAEEKIGIGVITLILMFVVLLLVIGTSYVATKIWNVDFYVVYQIMTFGRCLCSTTNKENN